MFIVRAVNIYPGHVDRILSTIEGIGSEYQVIIERSNGKDTMILKIERSRDANSASDAQTAIFVKEMLRSKILVTPEVEIVDYASLPRSERKTRRVFDNRDV
jgi:phenylacetate-CoA ligase